MAYDLEEQEKVDELKAWWKKNGMTVMLAVAVFAAVVVGMQGWRAYQHSQQRQAALAYEAVQNGVQSKDIKRIRDAAGQLIEKYPGTPYASRAALLAAGVNYESGDAKSAKAQLKWVVEHAKEEGARDIARLRLAGILLDEKSYEEAMKTLEGSHEKAFDGLFSDLKGDLLTAQGKMADARVAYKAALEKMDEKSAYRQVVEMKLDGLGERG
ncbi:MAG: tetratricopeptide repeat protein [Gammaproteobacteria bacterium]|nr:tetratricopeptide repeat protein [Gammaproteobacteria bacterium]MBU1980341.1 tetratricopeptide repeat protein [Gammaproteobacteria bacterium]